METLELINKSEINVLEAFAGDGFIWDSVRTQTETKINVLRIDEKPDKKGVYLKGNNLKFLRNIDLSNFDIIDLDAYGSPFKQLEIVFDKQYKGFVHCTFIQIAQGGLHDKILTDLGYTESMIKKVKTLLNKNGMKKMEQYLFLKGIRETNGFYHKRSAEEKHGTKNYFYFKIS